MKIVVAVHHFPPRHFGGAEREALLSAKGFKARGHDVRVVCVERSDAGPPDGLRWIDDEYEGLPVRRLEFDLGAAPDRFRWEYDNPWVRAHLEQWFREERPDVFLLEGGYLLSGSALAAARRIGVPTIVRLTDFWFVCPRITMWRSDGTLSHPPIDPVTCARCVGEESRRYRLPARIAPLLMKALWRLRRRPAARMRARLEFLLGELNQVDAILSPSQLLCNVYGEVGIDRRRLQFTRQGVELPAAQPQREPADHLRLTYLGQFTQIKGVDVLLRALRLLPRARLSLDLYGNLEHTREFGAQLRALADGDPRIQFRGLFHGKDALFEALARTDVIVVPSVWWENSPNVILEAFAHGVPVIASRLGGMAELVQHEESGLLFEPGDASDLAAQIARLASEPALLEVLRRGVPPIKGWPEITDELEDLCERLVARRADSRWRA